MEWPHPNQTCSICCAACAPRAGRPSGWCVFRVPCPLFSLACASLRPIAEPCRSSFSTECAALSKATTAQQLTSMSLALDWTPKTNHTGIYVALDQNWYRDEGIDLNLLPYSASVSPDVLVGSGKADVGISATEGVVSDAAAGQPVVSIAAIIQHNTSALVTLASSGLTRPRDLDGKVYGGFGAPYESAVVGEIIQKDGGKGQFKNVTLSIDAMQALETHRVAFVWGF